jgi:Protein of unknown function (DUF4238)
MAGIRQHYLPQFLQRSFANEAGLTWLFRKNERGLRTSTRNIGVERTFYTKPGDTAVDEAITTAEADFSRLVSDLRTGPPRKVSSNHLPNLFAHLEVRSRHLRQSFLRASKSLCSMTVPILNDTEKLQRLLVRHISNDPEQFEQLARDSLREKGLPESAYKALTQTVSQSLPQILQELAPELEHASATILKALPKTLGDSIKNSHNNALRQTIAPEQRVRQYETLAFRVEDIPGETMILGDCGPLFYVEGSKPFKAITEKSDITLAGILPISPKRLLIGESRPYYVEPSTIRTAIARCSLEFFIAVENLDVNTELAKLIGLDAAPLTDKEIEDIVDEVTS